MKTSTPLKQTNLSSYLKVVNNSLNFSKTVKKGTKRIYINTLVPDFKFQSNSGEVLASNKCVLL